MSFVLRLLVPLLKSSNSTMAVFKPRVTASRAQPLPLSFNITLTANTQPDGVTNTLVLKSFKENRVCVIKKN